MAEVTFFYSLHSSRPSISDLQVLRPATRPTQPGEMCAKSLGELRRRRSLQERGLPRQRSRAPPSFNQDANYHKPNCQRSIPRNSLIGRVLRPTNRLSLTVLMDRGQARLSGGQISRPTIELGLWPRFNDALASILSPALTNGEGGNYTGVAKPCKGAARDFEMRTNRPNTRRRNTGEVGRDNAHYNVFASPGKGRPKKPADTGSAADASRHK
jgi:hypothetical protein